MRNIENPIIYNGVQCPVLRYIGRIDGRRRALGAGFADSVDGPGASYPAHIPVDTV